MKNAGKIDKTISVEKSFRKLVIPRKKKSCAASPEFGFSSE
jgi:hypothetical protein